MSGWGGGPHPDLRPSLLRQLLCVFAHFHFCHQQAEQELMYIIWLWGASQLILYAVQFCVLMCLYTVAFMADFICVCFCIHTTCSHSMCLWRIQGYTLCILNKLQLHPCNSFILHCLFSIFSILLCIFPAGEDEPSATSQYNSFFIQNPMTRVLNYKVKWKSSLYIPKSQVFLKGLYNTNILYIPWFK